MSATCIYLYIDVGQADFGLKYVDHVWCSISYISVAIHVSAVWNTFKIDKIESYRSQND